MVLFDFHYHHEQKRFGIYNPKHNEAFPNYSFSTGLHPKDLDQNSELYFDRIKNDAQSDFCVAIGECGLDARIDVDMKIQEQYFFKHIELANELQKPLIIHCVRKFDVLPKFKKAAKVPMIIHGFNKRKTIAEQMHQQGFYLSFGNAVFHNVSLQEIVKDFPIEKLFLETDDLDFDIDLLYEKTSLLKGITKEELLEQILKNYETITNL